MDQASRDDRPAGERLIQGFECQLGAQMILQRPADHLAAEGIEDDRVSIGMEPGPPIGVQKGPHCGVGLAARWRSSWSRRRSDDLHRDAVFGMVDQARFLKRQLSLPVRAMSQ